MTTLVEVLAIYQSGKSDRQPFPQLLLVSKPNLTGVVYLGPDTAVLVQDVLHSHPEAGGAARSSPTKINSGFNIWIDLKPSFRLLPQLNILLPTF